MSIKRFKQTARFRINLGQVSFYATAKQIRNGVGDFSKCNAATQKALDTLEFMRSGNGAADGAACGIGGTWEGLSVQLTLA
jgi:exopolyphosphatase/pppGpp-phosphohydrolase